MNLSVLERMVRDGDLSADAMRYLLNCHGECEWLDYKEQLHLDDDKEVCDFGKDSLALKNVGGGYIVVGVQDKTWKPVGLQSSLPFDSKLLRDKIRRATGVDLDVDIVHHTLHLPASMGMFALVYVRSSKKRRKRRIPTMVAHDFCAGKPFGLRRGDIYARNGDSTVRVSSTAELEDLIDTLESAADQDAFAAQGHLSPFAIENGTYRLLERGFDHFIGRDELRTDILEAVTRDPRIWIVNVHGPGGVGKSALVNWAVYEFYQKGEFEAILHLTAKETILTPRGIVKTSRSLYSLENLLDHILSLFDESAPAALNDKKSLAVDYLNAWNTLVVLDNMETVNDGRILTFIQELPPETKAKVLLTSRQKTGGWELPIPVIELNVSEVADFVRMRSSEMEISIPDEKKTAEKFWQASGGLPLAIQWILGHYRLTGDMDAVLEAVGCKDSPVLEFSFGNIWRVLSDDAKAILAVMTIFDEPPTVQQLAIATEFHIDRIEKALSQLSEVTLVARNTQVSDGRTLFVALPITLSFARHQLENMGVFELACRQRFQKFVEQMNLQDSELYRFRSRFEQYGLETDNEKRAAVLCQRGESEMFVGNTDAADMLFRQARELAPQSAYVYAMSASYELARNKVGNALDFAEVACKRANKRTGALCYTVKARVFDVQRNRNGRVTALEQALEYAPEDGVVRHQYGVALSRAGRTNDAVDQFTQIIKTERAKVPPTLQLLMALKTRMINLKRLERLEEFDRDLKTAEAIFRDYPHLTSELEHFAEFFDARLS